MSKTNPKDLIGLKKVPLGLLPGAGRVFGALAMRDGAKKYGAYNWRKNAVKMSVYLDAIERHLIALRDGEDVASDSGVHHIGHIIACGAILADAMSGGNLIDDRPKNGPSSKLLSQFLVKVDD